MSIIKILSAEVAGRIAAGEVIERPASVVKELVENAIDAGATRIRIQIEQGGQKLIQVTDNGCGMDRPDALMCLEAHATSKMSKDGDVGQISTLGFRGEAIPSIASVSHFQLQTRRHSDDVGTEIIVDNGIVRDVTDCGCAPGTNIKVGYLFGNLPARRKFLKGADTEDGHIEEMILMLALARPEIGFSLRLGSRDVIRTTATTDLGARVMMLLGRDAFAAMLPVDYEEDDIKVRGFVSRPGYTRSSRREQRMIINGRAACAETLFFAIREAYDTLILKGRYPGCVLYVDMAPDRVDVNVHPAKREVRFRDPRRVGVVVAAAIRKALRQMPGGLDNDVRTVDEVVSRAYVPPVRQRSFPGVSWSGGMPSHGDELPLASPSPAESAGEDALREPSPLPVSQPACESGGLSLSPLPEGSVGSVVPALEEAAPASVPSPVPAPATSVPSPVPAPATSVPSPVPAPASSVPSPVSSPSASVSGSGARPFSVSGGKGLWLRVMGRLGKGHLVAEGRDGLVVVDIRGAHQRILFEKLLVNLRDKEHVSRQQLLFPVTVNLSVPEARLLKSHLSVFDALGFSIEPFGGTTYLVTAVPSAYPDQDMARVLRDMLEDLSQGGSVRNPNAVHLAQTACRHAISVRDELSEEEIRRLLTELSRAEMPYADPSGKPTMVHITYGELEKRFKG